MNHYVLGWLPRWARLVTTIPVAATLANSALKIAPLRKAVFAVAGLDTRRQMTAFTNRRFSRWFKKNGPSRRAPGSPAPVKNVILWADSFSEYLDPTAAEAMVEVLQGAGYTVRIPSSQACCGLTWISPGQLDGAKRHLRRLLDILGPAAEAGVPIIGVEPSCTAVLRSDLEELLPDDPRSAAVSSMTMTLAELLGDPDLGPEPSWFEECSLEGTKIVAQPHCHQHAVMGYERDLTLLRRLGAEVTPVSGCCGLAGNFGMEKGHYDVSVAVANNELLPTLAQAKTRRSEPKLVASTTGAAVPSTQGLIHSIALCPRFCVAQPGSGYFWAMLRKSSAMSTNASTMSGSKCVPLPRTMVPAAWSCEKAGL